MNANYAQPDLPAGIETDLLQGAYRFRTAPQPQITLMGSGAILPEVLAAADQLAAEGIPAEVISVTSWSELARDGMAVEQRELAGAADPGSPHLTALLAGSGAPVLAACDYVRAVPEQVRAFVPAGRRFITLGTDGFGRSDTRAALRDFFGVDAAHIAAVVRRVLGR